MQLHQNRFFMLAMIFFFQITACKKSDSPSSIKEPANLNFRISGWDVDGIANSVLYRGIGKSTAIKLVFPQPIDRSTVNSSISFNGSSYNITYQNGDSVLLVKPTTELMGLAQYGFDVATTLKSVAGGKLIESVNFSLFTGVDSTDKFPQISDNALLDKVQQQTFKFFWDNAHTNCGMAKERTSSPETVTTGGTGFGVMAIIVAVNRGFITRTEGRDRVLKIVNFLLNNCTRYHGAFAHWIYGSSGQTQPFSTNDNGADLIETSYLVQGLIAARQFFNGTDAIETDLRTKINTIWDGVEWNWFRQNGQNVLYWHWSPTAGWAMNMQIKGWNEGLITYVLASSSRTDSIPKSVYDNGWASNGNMKNGNAYYGYSLPLGSAYGGPLFFSHYSFLGINPFGLSDVYANYQTQVVNHTKINYEYCKANPSDYYGYGSQCWGLTACDGPSPTWYQAHSPTNDKGVIAPTAALSSFPYTPTESMAALKFFYYKLGNKLWGDYGFFDAFKLNDPWFASSTLAIDQGPIVVMIENYRSGLLWNLFTSAPEIKNGMRRLGFSAPYL